MSPANEPFTEALWASITRAVGARPVELDRPRAHVVRCRLGARVVWVKRPREVQDRPWSLGDVAMTRRLRTEWAGLRLLGSEAPALLAADLREGWLLLEDVAGDGLLVEPLTSGSRTRAEAALRGWGRAITRMHLATHGRRATHDRLRAEAGGWQERDWDGLLARFHALTAMGLSLPEQARALVPPAPHRHDVFVHGDPCPDNALMDGDRVRIIDFERAYFGPGLRDITALRMGQPTCWCAGRVPDPLVDDIEDAYRQAMVHVVDGWRDPARFAADRADAMAFHVVVNLCALGPEALVDDREWGTTTVRARLLTRLGVFLDQASGHPLWPWVARVRDGLEALWGPSDLPYFPAFRTG